MLVSSLEDFVKSIPTAIGTRWSALEPYMDDADAEMIYFSFGQDLMTALEALPTDNRIRKTANKIHSLLGYHHAIPFVDLVQTNTGFAVTNTQNLVPASKDRVERLIKFCTDQIDVLMDMLTEAIRNDEVLLTEWEKFIGYKTIFDSLFVNGSDFSKSVKVEGNKRSTFMGMKAEVIAIQNNIIAPVISKNYLNQLIDEIRNNVYQASSDEVITLCKSAIGQALAKNEVGLLITLNKISTLLDSNLAEYDIYAASDEYRLKHAEIYVNMQTDPTFFFGM